MSNAWYVDSEKIEIFPLSKNRNSQPNSRALTEDRIAGIVRSLIDSEGFIISDAFSVSDDGESTKLDKDFEFNVGGYFVTLKTGTSVEQLTGTSFYTGVPGSVWAIVETKEGEVYGQDDNTFYQGVRFEYTEGTDEPTSVVEGAVLHKLRILSYDGVSFTIPDKSRVIFHTKSFNTITCIDGKHS